MPSGATFVWPQDRAICGLHPRRLGQKGSKKTFMQPCGLRDLACPWGRLSFGLKTRRVAGYARGTLAQKALKNIHAPLRAAGFGVPSGATVVWPQGRAICGLSPRHLGPKGSKKNIYATLRAARFGASSGVPVVWPQGRAICGLSPRHLGPKGSKKNIYATLRAARFGASSGVPVVWPQGRAICGLRPRYPWPKGSKKHSCNPASCGIWRALGSDDCLASRPGGLRNVSAEPYPKGR